MLRARSADKKLLTIPASARKSRTLETTGCSSPSAARIRSSLVSRKGFMWRGTLADYPDLGPSGQGEVGDIVAAPSLWQRVPCPPPSRRRHRGCVLADAAVRL